MYATYVAREHTGSTITTVSCRNDNMESMSRWNKQYIALEIAWSAGKWESNPVEGKCRRRGGHYGSE